MSKNRIIIDPIYGFINVQDDLLMSIINHPMMQRLRRVSQAGLTSMVFNGATHSRFQHSLGAMYLMDRVIRILEGKGVIIEEEERRGLLLAILLHDVGHGPFSHALENVIIDGSHEALGIAYMRRINDEYGGALDIAMQIFSGRHPRAFLNQLVSSQIDMDRLDYLTRDSFYSGVVEGTVGYKRLLEMVNVHEDSMVIEERGAYTLEKFIMARRHMYLQVYLYPTALAMESMIIEYVQKLKQLLREGSVLPTTNLEYLLLGDMDEEDMLSRFGILDDTDIWANLKHSLDERSGHKSISALSEAILHRRPYKVVIANSKEECDQILSRRIKDNYYRKEASLIRGSYTFSTYNRDQEIEIMDKNGAISYFSDRVNTIFKLDTIVKHYICVEKL